MEPKNIPFHIIGLYLNRTISCTAPFCDFRNLPYYDKDTNTLHNSDVPFLGEHIISSPFNNKTNQLEAGVHLHFILPKVLTSPLQNHDDHSNLGYPPVPNKWTITKNNTETWIVESNFLSKKPLPHQNQITTSIPIISNLEGKLGKDYKHVVFEKNGKKYYQPFRYLGRVLTKEIYDSISDRSADSYWEYFYEEPLTMLGYGHPMFSMFYPNCQSVFGFHDPNGTDKDTYTVKGEWMYDDDFYTNPTFKALAQTLEKSIDSSLDEDQTIENLEFDSTVYALLAENDKVKILNHQPQHYNDTYTLAIGNTSIEAISAFLAEEMSNNEATIEAIREVLDIPFDTLNHNTHIEDILEAIQFGMLHQQEIDIDSKFIETRHAKGFSTHDSGKLWELSYRSITSDSGINIGNKEKSTTESYYAILKNHDFKNQIDAISISIRELNHLQKLQNKQTCELVDLQEQLFTLWYKYMNCAHPPEGWESTYPNPDKVFRQMLIEVCKIHILKKNILPNEEYPTSNQAYQGIEQLLTEFKNQGIRFDESNTSIHSQISAVKEGLAASLLGLNEDILSQTNEKGKLVFDIEFYLTTKAAPRFYLPNEPVILLKREQKAEDLAGFYPVFLEWEMDFIPVKDSSLSAGNGYPSGFLDEHFIHPSDEPDFQWKDEAIFSQGLGIYEGFVPLSGNSKKVMSEILEKAFDTESIFNEEAKTIAQVAHAVLNQYDIITQKLDGFNDALLQRKKAIQLAIVDPITSTEYASMIELIAFSVGENISVIPDINNDFNPIRGGGMNFSKLNLIDNFGRFTSVLDSQEALKVIPSEPFLPGEYSSNADTPDLFLPPRFIQPVRIDVRWIPANNYNSDIIDESTTQDESSPICGWIIPNNLEKSLLIFDHEGKQLGFITVSEGRATPVSFEPPPYDVNLTIDDIENVHLKNFVKYYIERPSDSDAVGFFQDSFRIINDSLEYISPDSYINFPELAIFMNRPVALVRAKVNFELMEGYAQSQSWDVFEKILDGNQASFTRKYEDVKIPIRLGDYKQLNDGVIGFWKDGTDDRTIDGTDKFYAPIAKFYQENQEDLITIGDNIDIEIQQSLSDDTQFVTMLFDPTGKLNVTTGVTPVKTIDIPDTLYKKILSKIQATFLIAPVITQREKVQIPTMQSEAFSWNWLQYQNEATDSLIEITNAPEITKSNFEKGLKTIRDKKLQGKLEEIWSLLIAKEWIKLVNDRWIVQSKTLPLENEDFKIHEDAFKYILENYITTIEPIISKPTFKPQEVIEGWLKLMPNS